MMLSIAQKRSFAVILQQWLGERATMLYIPSEYREFFIERVGADPKFFYIYFWF